MVQGRYFYYQLQPMNTEGSAYMDSLTINVKALIGDADLVVSTSTILPKIESTLNPADNQTFISR